MLVAAVAVAIAHPSFILSTHQPVDAGAHSPSQADVGSMEEVAQAIIRALGLEGITLLTPSMPEIPVVNRDLMFSQ